MGKLIHRVLGDARGKVGELVFKIYNGKVYITTHKGFNKISKSPSCVKNRKRFAAAIKFSKAVNSLDTLKEVWKQSSAEGKRTYSKILRFNIDKLLDGKPSKLNSIVPSGFLIDVKDLVFSRNSAGFSLAVNDVDNDYNGMTFRLNLVIALFTNNKDVLNSVFPYLCLSVDFINNKGSEFKNIIVNFEKNQKEYIGLFKTARVFLALTKTDESTCLNSISASFDECKI
jgi:hypothetical protein